jgi:hypothetical protein
MPEHQRQLTIDEAMGEFRAMVEEELGDGGPAPGAGPGGRIETPQEAETRQFLMAQYLIRLACPSASGCRNAQCRRDAMCRHLVRVRAKWSERKSSHPRRSPGASIMRYAVWVYVSARRQGLGRALGR